MTQTIIRFNDGNDQEDEVYLIVYIDEKVDWGTVRDKVIKAGKEDWSYQDLIRRAVKDQQIVLVPHNEERVGI